MYLQYAIIFIFPVGYYIVSLVSYDICISNKYSPLVYLLFKISIEGLCSVLFLTTSAPVKLHGGATYGEGSILLFDDLNNKWTSFCADGFDVTAAQVICRQLGLSGGVPIGEHKCSSKFN